MSSEPGHAGTAAGALLLLLVLLIAVAGLITEQVVQLVAETVQLDEHGTRGAVGSLASAPLALVVVVLQNH